MAKLVIGAIAKKRQFTYSNGEVGNVVFGESKCTLDKDKIWRQTGGGVLFPDDDSFKKMKIGDKAEFKM